MAGPDRVDGSSDSAAACTPTEDAQSGAGSLAGRAAAWPKLTKLYRQNSNIPAQHSKKRKVTLSQALSPPYVAALTACSPFYPQGFRRTLRRHLDNEFVEIVMVTLVIFYIVTILMDRAIFDVLEFVDISYRSDDPILTLPMRRAWDRSFWVVDMVFLTIFLVELILRVYAVSTIYLRNPLNVADGLLVLVSYVLSLYVTSFIWGERDVSESARRAWDVIKIARITRLFRLVPACIKVKERSATHLIPDPSPNPSCSPSPNPNSNLDHQGARALSQQFDRAQAPAVRKVGLASGACVGDPKEAQALRRAGEYETEAHTVHTSSPVRMHLLLCACIPSCAHAVRELTECALWYRCQRSRKSPLHHGYDRLGRALFGLCG